jgi:regulator of protease activity HflC (stomatin/prohibitin superfamily)
MGQYAPLSMIPDFTAVEVATVLAGAGILSCVLVLILFGTIVEPSTIVVFERCGKFHRVIRTPGLHLVGSCASKRRVKWVLPHVAAKAGYVSLINYPTICDLPANEIWLDIPEQHVNDSNGIELLLDPVLHMRIVDAERAVYSTENLYAAIEQVAVRLYRQAASCMTFDEMSRGGAARLVESKIIKLLQEDLKECTSTYGVELKMNIQRIRPASEQMLQYLTRASTSRMERQYAHAQMELAAHRGALVAAEYKAMSDAGMTTTKIMAFAELERSRALLALATGGTIGLGRGATATAAAATGLLGGTMSAPLSEVAKAAVATAATMQESKSMSSSSLSLTPSLVETRRVADSGPSKRVGLTVRPASTFGLGGPATGAGFASAASTAPLIVAKESKRG